MTTTCAPSAVMRRPRSERSHYSSFDTHKKWRRRCVGCGFSLAGEYSGNKKAVRYEKSVAFRVDVPYCFVFVRMIILTSFHDQTIVAISLADIE